MKRPVTIELRGDTDGWWRDSENKTEHEASAEAKRGACI